MHIFRNIFQVGMNPLVNSVVSTFHEYVLMSEQVWYLGVVARQCWWPQDCEYANYFIT